MNTSITARELFDQQKDKLALRWVAGQGGAQRELEAGNTVSRRPSLAGYLNAIYPNKVQILGSEELSWLDSLDSRQRWETIEKIMQSHRWRWSSPRTSPARKTCARPPTSRPRRCGSRPSAATNCSITSPTTWRARWPRGSPCTGCSWRSIPSAC
jgi:Serine kinase of the HPr protein, regulates carbohydrate metabolism